MAAVVNSSMNPIAIQQTWRFLRPRIIHFYALLYLLGLQPTLCRCRFRGVYNFRFFESAMYLFESAIKCGEHARERLDTAVLANVGLIQDKAAQDKKEIRTRTGLL